MKFVTLFLLTGFFSGNVGGHEVRFAYLSLEEVDNNSFEVFWKVPLINGMRAPVTYLIGGRAAFRVIERRAGFIF